MSFAQEDLDCGGENVNKTNLAASWVFRRVRRSVSRAHTTRRNYLSPPTHDRKRETAQTKDREEAADKDYQCGAF